MSESEVKALRNILRNCDDIIQSLDLMRGSDSSKNINAEMVAEDIKSLASHEKLLEKKELYDNMLKEKVLIQFKKFLEESKLVHDEQLTIDGAVKELSNISKDQIKSMDRNDFENLKTQINHIKDKVELELNQDRYIINIIQKVLDGLKQELKDKQ